MNCFKQINSLLTEAAKKWPHADALKNNKQSITYTELYNLSLKYTLFLIDRGIHRNDNIVVVSDNSFDSVALFFAVLNCQAAFIPVSYHTPDERVRYIAADSNARAIIYLESEGLYFNGEWFPLTIILNSEITFLPEEVNKQEDLACILYTSGSTGNPKGVASLHRHVMFASNSISSVVDYRQGDIVYCASPFSFDYGLYQIFLCMKVGACLYLASSQESGALIMKSLRSSLATVFAAVPTQLNSLATLLKKTSTNIPFLRNITSTGAAVPDNTLEIIYEKMPCTTVQLMYGLTECKRVSISPPNAHLSKPGTCGLPIPGTDVFIKDEAGNILPSNITGKIVVLGPHLMCGYWNDSERTNEVFVKKNAVINELVTGDYGWLDDEGYLYCAGRKDDIFKQNGFRVSCAEVENAVVNLETVHCAVLIPPIGKKGSVLFVVGDDTSNGIKEKLRNKLEDYKIPNKVKILEEMPLNVNGKIDKKILSSFL